MKNYAKIIDNTVVNIVVGEESELNTQSGLHIEITEETNVARIGDTYSSEINKFITPKPYESWTLNNISGIWEAPTEKPSDGFYSWNEEDQVWIKVS
jgi:hypothetical protein